MQRLGEAMSRERPFEYVPTEYAINPGGRLGTAPAGSATPDESDSASAKVRTLRPLSLPALQVSGGLADLVPFLILATRLRLGIGNDDPQLVLRGTQDEIGRVFSLLPERGWEGREAQLAKFFVCCAIDNAALNSPLSRLWATNQLVSSYFKSASGGAQFFSNVGAMLNASPGARPPLRIFELAYLCLVCGFEGRYGVGKSPREAEIDDLKMRLLVVIGEGGRTLASSFLGSGIPRLEEAVRQTRRFPVWPVAAVVAALCLGLVFFFRALLGAGSDAALAQLEAGAAQPMPEVGLPVVAALPQRAWVERLRAVVSPVGFSVTEDKHRVLVTASGGLFPSASDDLREDLTSVYTQIGALLNETRGSIVVRGHTDRQAMRSLQFRNNKDLARARAKAVGMILAEALDDQTRVYIEAVGEAEPLCADESAVCHARNRRVEIVLDPSK